MEISHPTPRLGVSTSAHAGTASGISSPDIPSPSLDTNRQARRRASTLTDDINDWTSGTHRRSNSAARVAGQQHTGNGHALRPEPRRRESGSVGSVNTGGYKSNGDPMSNGHLISNGLGIRSAGTDAIHGGLPDLQSQRDSDFDEGLTDDEETGLTDAARRKRRLRKADETQMDRRVAPGGFGAGGGGGGGGGGVGTIAAVAADTTVMKRSLVNVGLIGLWYLFSLSISIYNKWMFGEDHLDFPFPLFTTSTHMVVQFTLASSVLYFFPRYRPNYGNSNTGEPGRKGVFSVVSKWFYLTRLGPCGMATGLDIGLGNMSLKFITLTFFTMCKSSALAFVLLFAFVFKLETPSMKLVLIIATMTGGVIMMVSGEVNFDALGFILIMLSSLFSGFRWALTQILLLRHPATSNPFASIFFLTPIMWVSLLALAIPIEGFGPLAEGLGKLAEKEGTVLGPLLLLFPGVLAFCMTSAEYALLQRTSVVTLSITGIFKEVVTITAAEITYHDPLTPINLSGLMVTILCIGAYNIIKIQKMRGDAQAAAKGEANGAAVVPGLETPDADAYAEERRGMLADDLEMEEM